jgi:hypothetical protein
MKIDKQFVIQTWVSRGINDFYISFEFEDVNRWHEYSTFFCHQGLEKICKTYLLAKKAKEYDNKKQALEKINKIAKRFGHELRKLIVLLRLENVLSKDDISQKIGGYTGDELIDILEKAYIESRYPVPDPIYRKYPIANKGNYKMFSDPIGETAPIIYARKIALTVLKKIESDFSISISRNKISNKIDDKDWIRFRRIFFSDI